MGKKNTSKPTTTRKGKGKGKGKQPASAPSPATKLAKATITPLPRESSPDQHDNANSDEDDDLLTGEAGSEGDFDEDAFMKMVEGAEGDASDDELLDGEDDDEDDEDDGDESEDVSPEALERMMQLLGDDVSASDVALLKQMKGEGSDEEEEDEENEEEDGEGALEGETDDDDESEEEDEEEVAAALRELEQASDVDADQEDIVPVEKTTVNDKTALTRVLASIAHPSTSSDAGFFDTLTLVNPQPLGVVDASNDLERELQFYKQSLWAAMHAESLFTKADLPFHRPSDYFAEMVKTDAHMAKLRQSLLDEQAGMKASEDARKLRDAKKFGKKVQQERLREREVEKKRMKEGVEGLKKKRKNGDAFSTTEDFDVALEDALAASGTGGKDSKKRKLNESDRPGRGRKGITRNARDKKYGFGGKESNHRSKQNNEKEDERQGRGAFGGRGRGGRGRGRGGARGGKAQRPGKSRRQ
ncbi:hypothetical protein JCM10207_009087 [Rhodosporidiobolus poonsookiae]